MPVRQRYQGATRCARGCARGRRQYRQKHGGAAPAGDHAGPHFYAPILEEAAGGGAAASTALGTRRHTGDGRGSGVAAAGGGGGLTEALLPWASVEDGLGGGGGAGRDGGALQFGEADGFDAGKFVRLLLAF